MGSKRKRPESGRDPTVAQVDPTYGQRSFFPGLDDASDTEDAESAAAVAYFRSVRSEASVIPNLLVAPRDPNHDDHFEGNTGEVNCYYSDGAYLSTQALPFNDAGDANMPVDHGTNAVKATGWIQASTAYHDRLLRRYLAQRLQLRSSQPNSAQTLEEMNACPVSIEFDQARPGESKRWERIMTETIPTAAQLASMSQETIQWLVVCLPHSLKKVKWAGGNVSQGSMLSAWIWGLLACLDEVDTLSSEEVSVVRELGKEAGIMMTGLGLSEETPSSRLPDRDAQKTEDVEHCPLDASTGESAIYDPPPDLIAGGAHDNGRSAKSLRIGRPVSQQGSPMRRRNSSSNISSSSNSGGDAGGRLAGIAVEGHTGLTSRIAATDTASSSNWSSLGRDSSICSPEESLSATLDMTLTIIGEYYGQRDLLVIRRRLWDRD